VTFPFEKKCSKFTLPLVQFGVNSRWLLEYFKKFLGHLPYQTTLICNVNAILFKHLATQMIFTPTETLLYILAPALAVSVEEILLYIMERKTVPDSTMWNVPSLSSHVKTVAHSNGKWLMSPCACTWHTQLPTSYEPHPLVLQSGYFINVTASISHMVLSECLSSHKCKFLTTYTGKMPKPINQEIQICIKQTAKIENNLYLNNFCNLVYNCKYILQQVLQTQCTDTLMTTA